MYLSNKRTHLLLSSQYILCLTIATYCITVIPHIYKLNHCLTFSLLFLSANFLVIIQCVLHIVNATFHIEFSIYNYTSLYTFSTSNTYLFLIHTGLFLVASVYEYFHLRAIYNQISTNS